MNRRSFFQVLARAAAIVALAPQLAFGVKPLRFSPEEIVAQLNLKSLSTMAPPTFYDFIMSQPPYEINDLKATPLRHVSHISGCEINSLNESELRELFG